MSLEHASLDPDARGDPRLAQPTHAMQDNRTRVDDQMDTDESSAGPSDPQASPAPLKHHHTTNPAGASLLPHASNSPPSKVHTLEEANATIARLRAELGSLPAYYVSRAQLEHDRLASKNVQLRTQAQVLARKVATLEALKRSGGKDDQVKVDKGKGKACDEAAAEDGDDGTASQATEIDEQEADQELSIEELKTEKRALTADVFRLQNLLDVAEQQNKRLSHELRSLRAYFLHGSPLVTLDHEIALPSPPASQASPASPPRAKPRCVTLGDAEAELLLHAGKTLSHVHRVTRVPLSRAIADQADDIVRAREAGACDLPLPPSRDGEGAHGQDQADACPGGGGGGSGFDGLMQLANASSQEDLAPGAGVAAAGRRERAPRDWDELSTTPTDAGGSGGDPGDEDDIDSSAAPLHCDSDALDRPVKAGPSSRMGDDPDYLPSPPPPSEGKALTSGHAPPNPRQALGQRLNALDVLAQATAEMDPERSPRADVEHLIPTARKKPPVPNSRSRVPTLGPDGEKKPRSPYIKWNIQEDEQLLRAVIQVGCAWDNVAKLCPTRAYHQVRQRFLRGLRSGEQLPKPLLHLQEAVRKSVHDHEAKKKRKRLAKQAAQELVDSTQD